MLLGLSHFAAYVVLDVLIKDLCCLVNISTNECISLLDVVEAISEHFGNFSLRQQLILFLLYQCLHLP
jgi:hypothetical protein